VDSDHLSLEMKMKGKKKTKNRKNGGSKRKRNRIVIVWNKKAIQRYTKKAEELSKGQELNS